MRPGIVIICESDSRNLGDQAIARAMLEILSPNYDVRMVPLTRVKADGATAGAGAISTSRGRAGIKRILRAIPVKTRSRLVWYFLGGRSGRKRAFSTGIEGASLVVIGGGQLVKNNTALFCDHLALISRMARGRRIPYIYWGVGVDRKMSWVSWKIVKPALKAAEFITVRDDNSRNRLREKLGRSPSCAASPDVVFSLNRTASWANDRAVGLAINVMSVRVMLDGLPEKERPPAAVIRDIWFQLALAAVKNGASPVIFTTGSDEDLIEARDLCDRLADNQAPIELLHPRSLDELLDFLTTARNVLAARMHAGILSYISGGNVLCMNWDDKVRGVWSLIGEGHRVIDLDEFASGADEAAVIAEMFKGANAPGKAVVDNLTRSVAERIGFEVAKLAPTNA